MKSERRGSNSRQPAWKAGALPTELLSHYNGANIINYLVSLHVFLKKIKKTKYFFLTVLKLNCYQNIIFSSIRKLRESK